MCGSHPTPRCEVNGVNPPSRGGGGGGEEEEEEKKRVYEGLIVSFSSCLLLRLHCRVMHTSKTMVTVLYAAVKMTYYLQ